MIDAIAECGLPKKCYVITMEYREFISHWETYTVTYITYAKDVNAAINEAYAKYKTNGDFAAIKYIYCE